MPDSPRPHSPRPSATEPALAAIREALATFPPPLLQEFDEACTQLQERLDADALLAWADEGLAVARHSLRAWEAASVYCRVSAAVLDQLPLPHFQAWAGSGRDLAADSPALAAAYFRASPAALPHLAPAQAPDWGEQGRLLYRGTWKSGSLAAQYFDVSPAILSQLPLGQTRLLVELIDALAGHSYELASACLGMSAAVLGELDRADRAPVLEFGSIVANTAWADARNYFERSPNAIKRVEPQQRARFLALSGRVALMVGRQGHPYFLDAAAALAEVDDAVHGRVIALAEELLPHSGLAAMEFIKSSPAVLARVSHDDLARWHAQGLAILQKSAAGGEAFFRLESAKGEEVIQALSSRVELENVAELIRLYCRALTGADVAVLPLDALAERGVGWVSQSSPTTEGTAIYLPAVVEEHNDKALNFSVYKVFATHQAGRLEFDSFHFRFSRPATLFDDLRFTRAPARNGDPALTDMERFFDLFDDRRLIADLFTIVEDTRIDSVLRREYPGVRTAFERLQRAAVVRRRALATMPAREAAVENLVRLSLDAGDTIQWPPEFAELIKTPLQILARMRDGDASVEDSAEAALRLYEWIASIPNVQLDESQWLPADPPEEEVMEEQDVPQGDESLSAPAATTASLSGRSPQAYQSPEPVDFRGDFKPELVQMLLQMRGEGTDEGEPMPITPEQLKELIEKSAEIEFAEDDAGDLDGAVSAMMDNLMEEMASTRVPSDTPGQQLQGDYASSQDSGDASLPDDPQSFFYDEWDFRANDYKPRWCRLQQRTLPSGEVDFYNHTLSENAALVKETRKQFELLRPELFRKIRHLPDGEEFDLDAVVEWIVQRAAGAPTDSNLFYRRNKVERDVTVGFLLDMSASTDEEIHRRKRFGADDAAFDDDPRKYFTWWAQKRAREAGQPSKRIIDLEKDAIVLLTEALESIGDTYGIYGFSGYGRDNVEFYVIKDIEEPFSDGIKKRIDKITPVRSTRMGPAIRHAIVKLKEARSKVRILVVISDGRPQDHGYGRDRTEKEYAIHDTKMALTEARREGITPFCLTVDRQGHDYLQEMCQDMGYEVVSDIGSLPRHLPALYRRLTR